MCGICLRVDVCQSSSASAGAATTAAPATACRASLSVCRQLLGGSGAVAPSAGEPLTVPCGCGGGGRAAADKAPDAWLEEVKAAVARRGPDALGTVCTSVGGDGAVQAELFSSVLHMRGDGGVTAQPVSDAAAGVHLAWNGELYGTAEGGSGEPSHEANDTLMMLRSLVENVRCAEVQAGNHAGSFDAAVLRTLRAAQGPYAFVAVVKGCLYFGRDPLGRRSLLFAHSAGSGSGVGGLRVAVASVAPKGGGAFADVFSAANGGCVSEVPVGGVFKLEAVAAGGGGGSGGGVRRETTASVSFLPHGRPPLYDARAMAGLPVEDAEAGQASAVAVYAAALEESVRRRVVLAAAPSPAEASAAAAAAAAPDGPLLPSTGSRIGVLYSGGVDCAVVAALAHRHVPCAESIDLLNVSFGDFADRTPDRLSGRQGWKELKEACPGRVWNLIEVDVSRDDVLESAEHIAGLVHPAQTVMDVNIGSALWFGARGVGVLVPQEDSATLAPAPPSLQRLSKKPRLDADADADAAAASAASPAAVHDADFTFLVDALQQEVPAGGGRPFISLSDLSKQHPLPFRQAGCKKAGEYLRRAARAGRIEVRAGTGKGNTELFAGTLGAAARAAAAEAAEGSGARAASRAAARVRSSARVLLVGMGADETLGGYARYRTAFNAAAGGGEGAGFAALAGEMQGDFERLWRRNLGRDDRVVSDQAREARFPFLDEALLATVGRLPLRAVCNPRLPLGVGDKILVREAAARAGLPSAAALQKRAIQFGTRLANSRVDGTAQVSQDNVRASVEACMNPAALKRRVEEAAATTERQSEATATAAAAAPVAAT